jgi:hypothetical protein
MEKFLPGLSSNPERDKFWTRIERLPTGGTEIFVSHEAMKQQVSIRLPFEKFVGSTRLVTLMSRLRCYTS